MNLVDEIELEKKDKNDLSKKGYNFVGSVDHWTSIEQQKLKVDEIEKINMSKVLVGKSSKKR